MKRILFFMTILTALVFAGNVKAQTVVYDTAYMHANQVNDVYYSLVSGTTANVVRNNWDIAFYTYAYSDGIQINDGAGALLYSYPNGDTSAWSSVDTSGLYNWPKMFNADTNWQLGAFNQYASGHPDYGWGIYNIQNHSITGDSIFIIKLVDGSFKKLRILKKDAVANKYYIRWSNIDGSSQTDATIDCMSYTTKLFVAFSISNNAIVDREPAKSNWDLKFTKYMFPGYGAIQGVLTNDKVKVAKYFPINPDTLGYNSADFDTAHINVIGYSWKSMGVVKDSLVYFIKDVNAQNIYQFVFKSYSTPNGTIGFRKTNVWSLSTNEITGNSLVCNLFPNPTNGNSNLVLDSKNDENIMVNIMDLSGKIVLTKEIGKIPSGFYQIPFSFEGFNNGIYFMNISGSTSQKTIKFVVNK